MHVLLCSTDEFWYYLENIRALYASKVIGMERGNENVRTKEKTIYDNDSLGDDVGEYSW